MQNAYCSDKYCFDSCFFEKEKKQICCCEKSFEGLCLCQVWDIHSSDSNAVLTLAGHSGTVRCLNLNGNRLVSGSTDRSIKVQGPLHGCFYMYTRGVYIVLNVVRCMNELPKFDMKDKNTQDRLGLTKVECSRLGKVGANEMAQICSCKQHGKVILNTAMANPSPGLYQEYSHSAFMKTTTQRSRII